MVAGFWTAELGLGLIRTRQKLIPLNRDKKNRPKQSPSVPGATRIHGCDPHPIPRKNCFPVRPASTDATRTHILPCSNSGWNPVRSVSTDTTRTRTDFGCDTHRPVRLAVSRVFGCDSHPPMRPASKQFPSSININTGQFGCGSYPRMRPAAKYFCTNFYS